MRTLLALLVLLGTPALRGDEAPSPSAEETAVRAIRGIASNVQFNRDGTVRFVRFSKAIVGDDHLAHLRAFPKLDYLAVVTPTVTDAGLAHIAGLPNLDTLDLSRSSLTDAGAAALRDLPKLERLDLDDTTIGDAALEHVAKLPTLTTLSLRNTHIGDDGLRHLARLPNLDVLILDGTRITDAGLAHLAGLANLRVLHLERTAINGSGLAHLAKLPKLAEISLTGTQIEAEQLAPLAETNSLERILLLNTALNEERRPALAQRLPKVTLHLAPAPADERNPLQRYLAGERLRSPAPDEEVAEIVAPGPLIPPADTRFTRAVSAEAPTAESVPDFQRHVVPLLGRLGCNGRACHGSFQGRGGFRLSMFGYDFAADHTALTAGGEPRVDVAAPDESLILNKPTNEEAHGGGLRFDKNGWEHDLLKAWIVGGARGAAVKPSKLVGFETIPDEIVFNAAGEPVQLRVIATWADGTREDVTPITRFQSNDDAVAEVTADGLVRSIAPGDTHIVVFYDKGVLPVPVMRPVSDRTGDRYPHVPTPTPIDELVTAKLSKLGLVPSDLCTDEEFLRRVSLDLIGTLPTPDEVRSFLADDTSDKRPRKIDELLESPAYVEWWTMRLADLTGCNSQYLGTTDMNTPAAEQWIAWLRRRVQDNVGWDRIAAGMLLATSRRPGQTYDDYAAEQSHFMRSKEPADYTALDNPMHYYWFRSNNTTVEDRALAFGYVFLGVRLQCAQCHKHPFDQWSQRDFEHFSNVFARIERGVAPDAREAQFQLKAKLGVPTKLDTAALRRQMYLRVSAEGLPIPWNEVYIEPPGPKPKLVRILGGPEFDLNDFADPREPLVAWLLDDDNPYFARAFVNRIWSQHFGRGIVEPADDLNLANPPSNGPLLDWLATEFVARGFDVKWLHRTILASDTYQRSWRANATNVDDDRHFSRSLLRRLPAEVTIDAILQATAGDARNRTFTTDVAQRMIAQHPKSLQARGIDYSLLVFGKPLRTTNCDCERQTTPTLMQSLYTRNDTDVLGWLERPDGWLAEVAKANGDPLERESTTTVATGKPAKPTRPTRSPPPSTIPPTAERVDALITTAYLRTVNRVPTTAELTRSREHLTAAENPTEGLRDLLWALLNTREFLTNH